LKFKKNRRSNRVEGKTVIRIGGGQIRGNRWPAGETIMAAEGARIHRQLGKKKGEEKFCKKNGLRKYPDAKKRKKRENFFGLRGGKEKTLGNDD